MTWKLATVVFIIAIIFLIAVYDIIVYVNAGGEATISRVIYYFALDWPIANHMIGMIEGILIGHFFWPQSPERQKKT